MKKKKLGQQRLVDRGTNDNVSNNFGHGRVTFSVSVLLKKGFFFERHPPPRKWEINSAKISFLKLAFAGNLNSKQRKAQISVIYFAH